MYPVRPRKGRRRATSYELTVPSCQGDRGKCRGGEGGREGGRGVQMLRQQSAKFALKLRRRLAHLASRSCRKNKKAQKQEITLI